MYSHAMRGLALSVLTHLALVSAEGDTCSAGGCNAADEASLLQAKAHGERGGSRLSMEASRADEPNPPNFGENVFVVEAGEGANYEGQWNTMYEQWKGWGDEAQFGSHRTAILLKPGSHNIDVNLPYYFGVHGLGRRPSDTVVKPGSKGIGLRVDSQGNPASTNTFWRSIENLHMSYSPVKFWVSQAAPLRSVITDGELQVAGGGTLYASGGALMNSQIGDINMGTQQQWYTRGTSMNPYPHAAGPGSYVCVGCLYAPTGKPYKDTWDWVNPTKDQFKHTGLSYTDAPEVFAEKPYITFGDDKYYLRIPDVLTSRWGPTWGGGQLVPFERVYVASSKSSAATINAKIQAGKHVVFPPGIYNLDAPIVVNKAGTVLLGIGFATLIPTFTNGEALVQVGNVDGVRVAGLLLQAGRVKTKALLQWGQEGSTYAGSEHDPGFIYDVIGRVGGPDAYETSTTYMIQINNQWVIGDNVWLWQADHCVGGHWPCVYPRADTALEVNSDNVRMYGLMAEHTDKDIVVWNGDNGETMFFQSELRYNMGLKSQPKVTPGPWVAYRVTAKNHKAVGFGMYKIYYQNPSGTSGGAQWPLEQTPNGFSAVVVKHTDTYEWGFKDIKAANLAKWPNIGKYTCVCWDDDGMNCLDTHAEDSFR